MHSTSTQSNSSSCNFRDQTQTESGFCIWIPESEKILLVESRILGFGIRNTAQGIQNSTTDYNPEPKLHWIPVPRIQYPGRGIQNLRLSLLSLLEMGRNNMWFDKNLKNLNCFRPHISFVPSLSPPLKEI